MAIKPISFINRYPVVKQVAKVPGRPHSGTKQEVEWLFAAVDFKLGLGPCGKVVTRLDAWATEHTFTLQQDHADGTYKTFIYQMSDIAGRILIDNDEDKEHV